MKTRFSSNAGVCHAFATQSTEKTARISAGHLFAVDNVIYSYGYHFPIAKKLDETTILFTLRSYSNTTARHIREARAALSHYRFIYCYWFDDHDANLKQFVEDINELAGKLTRARSFNSVRYGWQQATKLQSRLEAYCTYYSIPVPDHAPLPEYSDQYLYELRNRDNLRAANKEARPAELATARLQKWLSFKTDQTPDLPYNSPVLVRFNEAKQRFETSKGVQIPLEAARRIAATIAAGTLEPGVKFMDYTVNEITDAHIKIGCHTFETAYLLETIQKYSLV